MSGKPLGSRGCRYCGHKINDQFPVVFLARGIHRPVGPFHPTCGDLLVRRARQDRAEEELTPDPFGIRVVRFDQEELPW